MYADMLDLAVAPTELFSALSDETRLRILCLLSRGELCVCDLMQLLSAPQSTLSRHLGRLRRAGLVTNRRDGKWVHYTLADKTIPNELVSLIGSFNQISPYDVDDKRLKAHLKEQKDRLALQKPESVPVIRVLVLCTGNSCRSQIAEGFLRYYGGKNIEVRSAGIDRHGVNPSAVRVMSEIGIDISAHTSNNLSEYLSDRFDYVITVCDNAAKRCPVFPSYTIRLHWPFDDPAIASGSSEDIIAEFRRIRDMIGVKVKEWLTKIETN